MDVWQEARKKLAEFYANPHQMSEQTHNPNPPDEEVAAAAQDLAEKKKLEELKNKHNVKQERRRII